MKVILVGRSDGVFNASRRVDSQFIGAVGEGHPAVLIVFRYDRLDLNFDKKNCRFIKKLQRNPTESLKCKPVESLKCKPIDSLKCKSTESLKCKPLKA